MEKINSLEELTEKYNSHKILFVVKTLSDNLASGIAGCALFDFAGVRMYTITSEGFIQDKIFVSGMMGKYVEELERNQEYLETIAPILVPISGPRYLGLENCFSLANNISDDDVPYCLGENELRYLKENGIKIIPFALTT